MMVCALYTTAPPEGHQLVNQLISGGLISCLSEGVARLMDETMAEGPRVKSRFPQKS